MIWVSSDVWTREHCIDTKIANPRLTNGQKIIPKRPWASSYSEANLSVKKKKKSILSVFTEHITSSIQRIREEVNNGNPT